jgi:two-component system chemotaxis response regulator CheB
VLVVDDSVVIRRLLADELGRDADLEVVGTAPHGRAALARLPQWTPDVVVLDIEMPEMDGLQALREMKKTYPRMPVIMFSVQTERGAAATLEALALGASDYFPKPSVGGVEASRRVVREQLVPKIKALCAPRGAPAPLPPGPAPGTHGRVDAVAVACSTGGPNALAELFAHLPPDFPVPILIVQHMPPMFTRLLAERLSASRRVPAEEGSAGAVVAPGRAYVAPGNHHMTVERDGPTVRLALNQGPPENSCRPAADVLFRSVARAYGPGALGVVLTGMGQDGTRGCEAIVEAGGRVVAQDEATSVVWGMPGSVARAGLAEIVLPLSLIAHELVRRTRGPRG